MEVFLKPLVDELQELWSEGVVVHDVASNTVFEMRIVLLMTINDFPTRSSLFGWCGQGYYDCPSCNDATPSMWITNKTCYVDHRQWLPPDHILRKNKIFDGMVNTRSPPLRKTTQKILDQLKNVGIKLPDKHEEYGGKKRKRYPLELNWSKKSIFWELHYWSSLSLHHNLDFKDIEKNVCESLLGTILNMEEKPKILTKQELIYNTRVCRRSYTCTKKVIIG